MFTAIHKRYMPKNKSTFTAKFTTKVGKTPVEFTFPVDFAGLSSGQISQIIEDVSTKAGEHFADTALNAKVKFKNQSDFKKAHKAFLKAQAKSTPAETAGV